MIETLSLSFVFAVVGVLMIIFRRPLATFLSAWHGALLPEYFARTTPSGVVLASLVWFFLAVLGIFAAFVGGG